MREVIKQKCGQQTIYWHWHG